MDVDEFTENKPVVESNVPEPNALFGCDEPFMILKNLLSNEDSDELKLSLTVKKKEILLMVLQYSVIHRLSQTAMSHLLQMINCVLQTNVLQESRYFLNKLYKISDYITYHVVCEKCNLYVGKCTQNNSTITCQKCLSKIDINARSSDNYFVTLNPSDDIRQLLEENDEYYNNVVNRKNGTPRKKQISDITDGAKYIEFVEKLPENMKYCYATLIFNADGSPVFESSKYSVWLIQIQLNEIPINVRIKSPILCGLWFGKSKPDMKIFLKPFVEEMNHLSDNGIECNIQGEQKVIFPFAIVCCADSVARAPMQGLHQFNGENGCNWCLHPGKHEKTGNSWKYSAKDGRYDDRLHDESVEDMKKIEELKKQPNNKTKHINGFISITVLEKLKKLDIIDGMVPDYLHFGLLGVARQFARYWFGTKQKTGILKKTDITKINDILLKIKPCSSVDRLVKPVEDRRFWKGKEWENWILIYSCPILKNFLDYKYVEHWSKFVESLYILLKTLITEEDLNQANKLLSEFVYEAEELYTVKAATSNVHQLLHVTKSVYNWGPLWAHSGFSFEGGNPHDQRYIRKM